MWVMTSPYVGGYHFQNTHLSLPNHELRNFSTVCGYEKNVLH